MSASYTSLNSCICIGWYRTRRSTSRKVTLKQSKYKPKAVKSRVYVRMRAFNCYDVDLSGSHECTNTCTWTQTQRRKNRYYSSKYEFSTMRSCFWTDFIQSITCMNFSSSCRSTTKHTLRHNSSEMDGKPFHAFIYNRFLHNIMMWHFSSAWDFCFYSLANASVFGWNLDDKYDNKEWSKQGNNVFAIFQHINTVLVDYEIWLWRTFSWILKTVDSRAFIIFYIRKKTSSCNRESEWGKKERTRKRKGEHDFRSFEKTTRDNELDNKRNILSYQYRCDFNLSRDKRKTLMSVVCH